MSSEQQALVLVTLVWYSSKSLVTGAEFTQDRLATQIVCVCVDFHDLLHPSQQSHAPEETAFPFL